MICPLATWKPVSNAGGPMANHFGLVLHVQQGFGSLYGYFNNPASQVSAHFWCSRTGQLEQYVDTNRIAWAEMAGNPNYLSVETEGFDNEALTPEQIDKVAELLAWLSSHYSFPITGPVQHGQQGFTPHCNPNGTPDPAWGNHTCPGTIRLGQMPAIIAATGPPTKEENETMTSIVIGGQLHVFGVIGSTAWHWWQEIGPPASTWHSEQLPS